MSNKVWFHLLNTPYFYGVWEIQVYGTIPQLLGVC
jgi:hypothetical protein